MPPSSDNNTTTTPTGKRGKELPDFTRGMIVGMSMYSKLSYRDIATKLNIPKSTVGEVVKKYKGTGHTTNKPRSGRPPKTTEINK